MVIFGEVLVFLASDIDKIMDLLFSGMSMVVVKSTGKLSEFSHDTLQGLFLHAKFTKDIVLNSICDSMVIVHMINV
jgi:hypothetical protein